MPMNSHCILSGRARRLAPPSAHLLRRQTADGRLKGNFYCSQMGICLFWFCFILFTANSPARLGPQYLVIRICYAERTECARQVCHAHALRIPIVASGHISLSLTLSSSE